MAVGHTIPMLHNCPGWSIPLPHTDVLGERGREEGAAKRTTPLTSFWKGVRGVVRYVRRLVSQRLGCPAAKSPARSLG